MAPWSVEEIPDLTGKVAIVTGGNSGIGYIASKHLLNHNAKVYVANRDYQKSREALENLEKETGKEAVLLPLDLGDLRSVRRAAEEFLSKETKLDILMNNAGIMGAPIDRLTIDGYDMQFGINVLGHFQFTKLLLPVLLSTSGSRVINISSKLHNQAKGINFESLKGPKEASSFSLAALNEKFQYYGQSKLGNILFTNELHRRFNDKGLISISVHPGVIVTDLTRNSAGFLRRAVSMFGKTAEYGATTQLYAATSSDASKLSGSYLGPIAKVDTPTKFGQDEKLGKELWEWCEQETKEF